MQAAKDGKDSVSIAGIKNLPLHDFNLQERPGGKKPAVEVQGDERDQRYAEQARSYPGFADYESKTSRTIPVVALDPVS